jgi:hypothetical protein
VQGLSHEYRLLPSDIIDPHREHLDGFDRLVFDALMASKAKVRAKLQAGDKTGISASDQADFEMEQIEEGEFNELEQLKEKMRQDGRRPG